MSSGNVYERLFKLWGSIVKMILDGSRDPGEVADVLQGIIAVPGPATQVSPQPAGSENCQTVFTREVWRKVYDALGCVFDESVWMEPTPGFWDAYVQKGVTANRAVAAMRKLGIDVWTYVNDLDRDVPINDRDSKNGIYRIRFRANVEADPDLKSKSAKMLSKEQVEGITLIERLLLGLAYFITTDGEENIDRRHLDADNITLCSGSRHSVGCVPRVRWFRDHRRVYVGWSRPVSRSAGLRTRSAVS